MPCDVLAKWLADNNQVYTQHAYMRVMAVETMFIGINDDNEDDKKPMLYKVRSPLLCSDTPMAMASANFAGVDHSRLTIRFDFTRSSG